jgi:hypothetical protein
MGLKKLLGFVKKGNTDKPVGCIFCGTKSNIMMCPHYREDGILAGWLFVCNKHIDFIKDHVVTTEINLEKE